jgi:hypothetical protein
MNLRIFACSVAFAALPCAALAQPYPRNARGPQYEPQYQDQMQSYAVRRGEAQCYAWCLQDYSPCDPANFKIADGRCRPAGAQGFDR